MRDLAVANYVAAMYLAFNEPHMGVTFVRESDCVPRVGETVTFETEKYKKRKVKSVEYIYNQRGSVNYLEYVAITVSK